MPAAWSPDSSAAPSSRHTYNAHNAGGAAGRLSHSSSVSSRLSVASSSSSRAPSSFTPTKSASSPAVVTADESDDFQRFLDQAHAKNQQQSRPKARAYNLSPREATRSGAADSLRRVASSSNIDNQQRRPAALDPSVSHRSDQAPPTRTRKNSTLSTASAARRSVSSTVYRNPTSHFLQQLSSEAQTPELGLDDTHIVGRSADSRSHLTALGHAAQLQNRSNSATYTIGKGKGKAVHKSQTAPPDPRSLLEPTRQASSRKSSTTSTSANSTRSTLHADLAASTSTIGPAKPSDKTTGIGLGLPFSPDTMAKRRAEEMDVDETPQPPASSVGLSPATPNVQNSPAPSTRSWFGLVRARETPQEPLPNKPQEAEPSAQPVQPEPYVPKQPPPPMNEDEAAFRRSLGLEATFVSPSQDANQGASAGPSPVTAATDRRASWLPWRQYSSQVEEPSKPSQPLIAADDAKLDTAQAPSAEASVPAPTEEARPVSVQSGKDTDTIKYRTVLKRGWMGARYEVQEPIPRAQDLFEAGRMPAAVELRPEQSPRPTQSEAGASSATSSLRQASGGGGQKTSGAWRWRVWGGPPSSADQPDVRGPQTETMSTESASAQDISLAQTAPSIEAETPAEGTVHVPSGGDSWTYSSYLASWVPTWVYNGEPEAQESTQDVDMADAEVPAQPRTPAEQVKADALARDFDASKAILNDNTRSGWISFFASRSANLPRPMPDLVKDADGMEVMDISDMGDAIGSSSSPRIPAAKQFATKPATAKQIASSKKGGKDSTLAASTKTAGSRASSVAGGHELARPSTPLLSTSKENAKLLGKAALTKAANATAASSLGLGKGKRQDAGAVKSASEAISGSAKGLAVEENAPSRSGASTPARSLNDPGSKFAPNLVLPSFDDTFGRAPRMWAPKVSMLERTLSAVNSYLFSRVPDLERMNRPTRYSHYGSELLSNGSSSGKTLKTKRSGQHLAGKSKVSGLGSSKDKGVEQALKEVAEMTQRLPRAWHTVGSNEKAQTKGTLGISKIVVIGVHGWFTQSIFKTMIGELTGTSSKFAAMQAESVRRHFLEAGLELNPEAITVISLQGDGKVADRVDRLFSEMISRPKWVTDMKEADAIFLSAHSQGAIVATQLLARLIEQRHIQAERTRVCLLTMCGIHHGPFAHLKSSVTTSYINYFETAAAKELFEFQSSSTSVSQQYTAALRIVLDAGAKCVYVGSTDDNVVPIYSALNSGNNHPSILRALYIDGQAFPKVDFLTNLLVMCVAVRNAGLNDYNLLTLLSASVAGSLYGGKGHSNVYEERAVYDLATRYLFEVTHPLNEPTLVPGLAPTTADNDGKRAPTLASEPFEAQRWNPYELPWSLRGLFEDKQVRSLFAEDILNLLNSYEDWKPDPRSKPLKDLQWRLAPMRSIARPMIQEEPGTGPYDIAEQTDTSQTEDGSQNGKGKNAKL